MKKLFGTLPLLLFMLLVPAAMPASQASQTEQATKIFIVNSYNPEYFWSAQQQRGIRAAYEGHEIEVEEFYLDSKRNPGKEWLDKKVAECLKKIEAFSPDIIFTGDDNATKTIGKHFYGSDTPVVFYGVNAEPWEYSLVEEGNLDKPGKNVTGVLERHFYSDAIYLIDTLNESRQGIYGERVKTIYLITDNSYTSKMLFKHLSTGSWQADKEIVFLPQIATFSQYKAEIEKINKPSSAVFIYNLQTIRDAAGRIMDDGEILKWTMDVLMIPSIAFHGSYIEEGLMAGILVSGFNQAYWAGKKGVMILNGTPPGEIPIAPPERGKVVINSTITRKLGMKIPISLLLGSTIYPAED